ncbi:MAG TPA: YqgQ family protein [Bacillota bacterium]
METVYDVRQLLKKFGIFIYIGERLGDLELMELEITQLYQVNCISTVDYNKAIFILRKEARRIRSEE